LEGMDTDPHHHQFMSPMFSLRQHVKSDSPSNMLKHSDEGKIFHFQRKAPILAAKGIMV
jgi:hypothetical protein